MASGDTLIVFYPMENEPPTTVFATDDTRNTHPVLDFDDTVNEEAVFSRVMPQNYDGGGLTVIIGFSATTATTGNVDWDVAFEQIALALDVDGDSFAAVNSIDNVNVSGTSGILVLAEVTFTDGADMDSILVGELFRMKLIRDAVSDTLVGDAEVHFIEVRET